MSFCSRGLSASKGGGLQNLDPHWILRDTVNERAVRILLESIPVFSCDQVKTKKKPHNYLGKLDANNSYLEIPDVCCWIIRRNQDNKNLHVNDWFYLLQKNSVLQLTFRMGRSYLPLAEQGLDALELWRDTLPESVLKPYYPQILPYLDAYLKTSTDISNFTFESINWNNFYRFTKAMEKIIKMTLTLLI